eukprot:CAMPEP_0197240934 /NCGR_PEP_ID=MMETSP1429-20130617/7113_1 /TAXON_ID=49237 /ORGANISM="Chaetoceros  sp., Strain UNC1202" /LENGTH=319 /DNA_ID=CAMNT_0042700687 /DNA_START=20 /DNA_END=979 /DNA_ORIENTATION=+
MKVISSCLIALSLCHLGNGFAVLPRGSVQKLPSNDRGTASKLGLPSKNASTLTILHMSGSGKYTTEVRLREEAEAPFRKVRLFLFSSLLGGCIISLLVSAARIAAGLNGINTDLLEESTNNAAIDVGGLAVLGYLIKNDLNAQESRLQRMTKGGALANLTVRGKASFFLDQDQGNYNTLKLSSFRNGRGIDKRIVICAAGKDKISSIIEEIPSLAESLVRNELVVIPVVLPDGTAPVGVDEAVLGLECLALPMGGSWKTFIEGEVADASKQGVDVSTTGVALILKKNGRVGQRTSGVNLARMTGEVEDRQASGMDVTNI